MKCNAGWTVEPYIPISTKRQPYRQRRTYMPSYLMEHSPINFTSHERRSVTRQPPKEKHAEACHAPSDRPTFGCSCSHYSFTISFRFSAIPRPDLVPLSTKIPRVVIIVSRGVLMELAPKLQLALAFIDISLVCNCDFFITTTTWPLALTQRRSWFDY